MRPPSIRTRTPASLRWLAGLLAALVLAALAGAVSPAVHGWLHGHGESACAHDDGCGGPAQEHSTACAAVLLAGAADAASVSLPVPRPVVRLLGGAGTFGESAFVPAPRRLRMPGRAPPPTGKRQA